MSVCVLPSGHCPLLSWETLPRGFPRDTGMNHFSLIFSPTRIGLTLHSAHGSTDKNF